MLAAFYPRGGVTYRLRMNRVGSEYYARDEGKLPLQSCHRKAEPREEDAYGGVQENVGQMEQLRSQSKE